MLMWVILTVGVITSSFLYIILNRNGISESNSLSVSVVILFLSLILGIILIPRPFLKKLGTIIFAENSPLNAPIGNTKTLKTMIKDIGIFIAINIASVFVFWITLTLIHNPGTITSFLRAP